MTARPLRHKFAENYQVFYFQRKMQNRKPSAGNEKAEIESEFNYKACCNDDSGLKELDTKVYQPITCSRRTCFYEKYLPFSLWITKQASLDIYIHKFKPKCFLKQVILGCGCCLRYDPKTGKEHLVADGTTWEKDGKVFGKQFVDFTLLKYPFQNVVEEIL